MVKVDAKIELIRTHYLHEIERLEGLEGADKSTTFARIQAVKWCISKLNEVQEKVR